eukprot:2263805-Amphidinium_carterae.1
MSVPIFNETWSIGNCVQFVVPMAKSKVNLVRTRWLGAAVNSGQLAVLPRAQARLTILLSLIHI